MAKKVICEVLKNIRDNGKNYLPGEKITLDESRAKIFAQETIGHVKILGPAKEDKK